MPLKLTNNAESTLANAIGPSDDLTLVSDGGLAFPAAIAEAGDWFPVYLLSVSDTSKYEIAHVIRKVGDLLSVTRGEEGTTAQSFDAGDRVELRMTAEAFNSLGGSDAQWLEAGSVFGTADEIIATVTELTNTPVVPDGTFLRLKTNAANTSPSVTLDVGSAGPKAIRIRDNENPSVGAIAENTVLDLVFDSDHDAWILNNPFYVLDPNDLPRASTTVYGTVQEFHPAIARWQPNTTIATVSSGDGRYMTEAAVNVVVNDYDANREAAVWPATWSYFGSGVNRDRIVTGVSRLVVGSEYNYKTYEIQSTGQVVCRPSDSANGVGRGVVVIRATEHILIDGLLILPDAAPPRVGGQHIGPRGWRSPNEISTGDEFPDWDLTKPEKWLFEGDPNQLQPTPDQLEAAIRAGIPFHQFRGGMGSGNWRYDPLGYDEYEDPNAYRASSDGGNTDQICPGGTLILIAPEVRFGPNARVVMNSRTPVQGNILVREEEIGDSGGGMIVVASQQNALESIVDGSSEFAAGKDRTVFRTASQWFADRNKTDPDWDTRACNAGNGSLVRLILGGGALGGAAGGAVFIVF